MKNVSLKFYIEIINKIYSKTRIPNYIDLPCLLLISGFLRQNINYTCIIEAYSISLWLIKLMKASNTRNNKPDKVDHEVLRWFEKAAFPVLYERGSRGSSI